MLKELMLTALLTVSPLDADIPFNYSYANSFAEGFKNSSSEYIRYSFDIETHLIPQQADYSNYSSNAYFYSYFSTLTINDYNIYDHMKTTLQPLGMSNTDYWTSYLSDYLQIKASFVMAYDNINTNKWYAFDTDSGNEYECIVCYNYVDLVAYGGSSYDSTKLYYLINSDYGNYSLVRDNAYADGYSVGRRTGYSDGYSTGLAEGQIESNGTARVFTWFKVAFSTMTSWLGYDVLPDISIGLLVSIPLVVGIIMFVINFFKGEG